MPLPKEITPIKEELGSKIILIYGSPKIGKTECASGFPNAIFMATEPGLNNIAVFRDDICTWEQFLANCQELAEEFKKGKQRFKTIVIDTIDILYKLCSEYVCKKHKISHESDLGFGKGFAFVNNEFQRALLKVTKETNCGLVMISHSEEKEVETRVGKIKKSFPTLPGGARKIVLGLSDIILFCDVETLRDENNKVTGNKRVLRTKPTQLYEAGDRTKRLSETIELSYQALVDDYNKNKVLKGD